MRGSIVVTVRGNIKVGIIGYVTPETKDLASTGNVVFLDEVESIRREVNRLRRRRVTIFIAVGHSGYKMDQKIAAEVRSG
jgi:2',3'-cyclic-nucleotide 2'-phosphodiesterase (5'-nucleotidase family)